MSIKTVRNQSGSVQNYLRQGSNWIRIGQFNYTDVVNADAVWSRARPSWLSPTTMKIDTVLDSYVSYESNTRRGHLTWVYPGYPSIVTNHNDDGSAALNHALSKLSGSEGNLGIALGTIDQTASLLDKTLDRMVRFSRHIRRRDYASAARSVGLPGSGSDLRRYWERSGDLARGYAETSWAWRPLVEDVGTAGQAVANVVLGNSVRRPSGRSGGPRSRGLPDPSNMSQYYRGGARVSGRIHNRTVQNLNALGLLNPFVVLWDRVPYSFVFDWAIPFGTYLGAITATAGLDQVRATRIAVSGRSYTVNGLFYTLNRRVERIPTAALPSINGLVRTSSIRFGQVVSTAALGRLLLK